MYIFTYCSFSFFRIGIVNYLSTYFPRVQGFVFGSSANNLGFTGCDVDLYLDVGVYPWLECETEGRIYLYVLCLYLKVDIHILLYCMHLCLSVFIQ